MEFGQFIKTIASEDNVLGDITYLQKHLSLCVEFHQELAQDLYMPIENSPKTMARSRHFHIIREFMNVLEGEMEDISQEQKKLVAILNEFVDQYCKTLIANEPDMTIDRELLNGYVSRAIDFRRILTKEFTATNVTVRTTENKLKEKYEEILVKINTDRELLKAKRPKLEPVDCNSSTSGTASASSLNATVNRESKSIAVPGKTLINDEKTGSIERPITPPYDAVESAKVKEAEVTTTTKKSRKRKIKRTYAEIMADYPPPPQSPESKNPTQEEFLMIFGLIRTEKHDEIVAQSKTRRTRRSINKTHLNDDYFYGDFKSVDADDMIPYKQRKRQSGVLKASNEDPKENENSKKEDAKKPNTYKRGALRKKSMNI